MNIIKNLISGFILFLICTTVNSQSLTMVCGGTITSENGNVSYSIGQLFYTTISSSENYIIEGLQQPLEITKITSIENEIQNELNAIIFPNPVKAYLNLELSDIDLQDVSYQIIDMQGIIKQHKTIYTNQIQIDFQNFPQGLYFLKIIYMEKEVKIFKVVKN